MKPPVSAPLAKAVSGLDQGGNTRTKLPASAPGRALGFLVAVAKFLLLFRLRARRRSALCADMLEHAVRMVWVTCKNWFTTEADHPQNRPLSRL